MTRRKWISLSVIVGAITLLLTGLYLYRCYAVQQWSNKGGGEAAFFLVPSFEGALHFHSSWTDRTWERQHCVHLWKRQTAHQVLGQPPMAVSGVVAFGQPEPCVLETERYDGYNWLDWL